MALAIHSDNFFSLLIRQVLDALLGVEVELTPYPFILGIIETEGMLAIKMHMPECCRDAASDITMVV